MLNQFYIILPEIMLAIVAIFVQLLGLFCNKSAHKLVQFTLILSTAIICYLLFSFDNYGIAFTESFATSYSTSFFKALIFAVSLMSIVIYHDLTKIAKQDLKIEFITLVLLSTLGGFIAISARDFILLFCGLELQALAGYALASFNSGEIKSSEAGLKYFTLGAMMSALMLMGISLLYGFSGSIRFTEISIILNNEFNIALVVGTIFILSAILFKLSAAPLHVWTPDVYEGSPISSVSYFATAQKLIILIVLINLMNYLIGSYTPIGNKLIKIIAIISMIVGSLGAIMQSSIKRLMAYSTVLNIGYVLIGISLQTTEGQLAALIYMLVYIIAIIAFFACIVSLFGARSDEVVFDDLKDIANKRKTLAASIAIIMFSMIGLPPMAGFFGKYYIFYNAINQGEFALATLGILTSVIAAFYYLKIIKYMYFMDGNKNITIIPTSNGLRFITIISLAFILFFFASIPIYQI